NQSPTQAAVPCSSSSSQQPMWEWLPVSPMRTVHPAVRWLVETRLPTAPRLPRVPHSPAIQQLHQQAWRLRVGLQLQPPVPVEYRPTPAARAIEAIARTRPAPPAARPLPAARQDVELQPSHASDTWPRWRPGQEAPRL